MKFFKFTTLYLFYHDWGAKTTCRVWKGGDGIKKYEKHCIRPWIIRAIWGFVKSVSFCSFVKREHFIFEYYATRTI